MTLIWNRLKVDQKLKLKPCWILWAHRFIQKHGQIEVDFPWTITWTLIGLNFMSHTFCSISTRRWILQPIYISHQRGLYFLNRSELIFDFRSNGYRFKADDPLWLAEGGRLKLIKFDITISVKTIRCRIHVSSMSKMNQFSSRSNVDLFDVASMSIHKERYVIPSKTHVPPL